MKPLALARPGSAWRDDRREAGGVLTFARVVGAGPPVVLVPGLGGSHSYFRTFQAHLARAHEVWAYDPPGYGRTRTRPGQYLTIASHTDHLAAWLEAAGLGGAAVLGYSIGAEVAVDLAARYPGLASALVLSSPTGVPESPSVLRQAVALLRDGPRERLPYLAGVALAFAQAGPGRVVRLAQDQHRHRTVPRLAHVRVPVLLLRGGRDVVTPPYTVPTIREALPLARSLEFPDAGHAVHDRHARAVAEAVIAFLAEVRAGRPPGEPMGRPGSPSR